MDEQNRRAMQPEQAADDDTQAHRFSRGEGPSGEGEDGMDRMAQRVSAHADQGDDVEAHLFRPPASPERRH